MRYSQLFVLSSYCWGMNSQRRTARVQEMSTWGLLKVTVIAPAKGHAPTGALLLSAPHVHHVCLRFSLHPSLLALGIVIHVCVGPCTSSHEKPVSLPVVFVVVDLLELFTYEGCWALVRRKCRHPRCSLLLLAVVGWRQLGSSKPVLGPPWSCCFQPSCSPCQLPQWPLSS